MSWKPWRPWSWTINWPAGFFYLPTRAAAVAKVTELQGAGHGNSDVGCMQIDLHHHPGAFASLDQTVDPDTNFAYAAPLRSGGFLPQPHASAEP